MIDKEAVRNAALDELINNLKGNSDAAYIKYIDICKRKECLGEEYKISRGLFGKDELKAHRLASESLGMHKAFAEVIYLLRSLKSQPAQPSDTEILDWLLSDGDTICEMTDGSFEYYCYVHGRHSGNTPRDAIKAAMHAEREGS